MLQIERANDPRVALQTALKDLQSRIWTTLPAKVLAFDPTLVTVDVQPLIQGVFVEKDGSETNETMPVFPEVPVIFPHGGGYSLTFPLAAGDEGLLVFASRCIDAWWIYGDINPQAQRRMHDLSDGLFLPGLYSKVKKPAAAVNTSDVQLRSDDGTTYIGVKPGHIIEVVAPSGVTLKGSDDGITTIAIKPGNIVELTAAGGVNLKGNVAVQTGTPIKRLLTGTVNVAAASLPVFGGIAFTGTITGAKVGDSVIASPTIGQNGLITTNAWVSSNNTVTIQFQNTQGTGANQPVSAQTYNVTVIGWV